MCSEDLDPKRVPKGLSTDGMRTLEIYTRSCDCVFGQVLNI